MPLHEIPVSLSRSQEKSCVKPSVTQPCEPSASKDNCLFAYCVDSVLGQQWHAAGSSGSLHLFVFSALVVDESEMALQASNIMAAAESLYLCGGTILSLPLFESLGRSDFSFLPLPPSTSHALSCTLPLSLGIECSLPTFCLFFLSLSSFFFLSLFLFCPLLKRPRSVLSVKPAKKTDRSGRGDRTRGNAVPMSCEEVLGRGIVV